MLQVLPPQRLHLHRCANAITMGRICYLMPSLYFGRHPLYSAPLCCVAWRCATYCWLVSDAASEMWVVVPTEQNGHIPRKERVLLVTGIY